MLRKSCPYIRKNAYNLKKKFITRSFWIKRINKIKSKINKNNRWSVIFKKYKWVLKNTKNFIKRINITPIWLINNSWIFNKRYIIHNFFINLKICLFFYVISNFIKEFTKKKIIFI